MNQQDLKDVARAETAQVTLSGSGDGVITTDVVGSVTSLNPAAQHLTGWSSEEAKGQPVATIFHAVDEETREKLANPASRALRDGATARLANHTLLIARDGVERVIEDSATLLRDDSGRVSGAVLVFRDLTEQREQEQRGRDALEYAASILATVREPLLVLDGDLRVLLANRSFYRVFETTPEETEGRLLYAVDEGQWDMPEVRRLLEDGLPHDDEFDDLEVTREFPRVGRKSLILNVRRLASEEGHAERILLAMEDATAREIALSALEASELKYRRLFEAAHDGILILDAVTGRIVEANPFIQNVVGRSREELLGLRLWDIGSLANIAENEARFAELRDQGQVRYDHLPLETDAGFQIEVEFVSNVYDVDGQQVIQCNIRDITERRRLERDTERQAEELADLDRRKDEFLAMLSHELRNPLAPITSAVRLLSQQPENAAQRQAREIIGRQAGQLTHLVDDLLEISRITTGRIRLRLQRVDLRAAVDRALEATAHEMMRRRHAIESQVPTVPIWIDGDAVRLEQVIVNLLTNAAKYTDDGGRITLSLEQQGRVATLRVSDTGVGIEPSLLPHIFDLFAQGERSLARSEGGLGIGLALVKQLTEMHGGSVDVSDAPGGGTEFVVRLPLALATGPEPPMPTPEPPEATPDSVLRNEKALRVLIVDDNADTARLIQLLVEDDGHQGRLAFDGPTALAAALQFQPQVALLDIGLPGWDGFEVARRIRLEPALVNVVLIAISGYGRDADRVRATEAGFDHYLVKPPDFDRLLEIFEGIPAT